MPGESPSFDGALIGYARVSTNEQNADLQVKALDELGCARVFTEKRSAGRERPELAAALEFLREGDTLVVWRLDRLARSLRDLLRLVDDLAARGIGLRSLNEDIDTTTANGRLVMHVFGALAEFERSLIRERMKAGLEAARARGRKGGRRSVVTPGRIGTAATLLAERDEEGRTTRTYSEIAEAIGVSRSTLVRHLAKVKAAAGVPEST